ncbi:MAG: NAD-dependent epimerase/dehydratase family protein [Bernardetiaceae bacterium]|nr:NAD-dependent epimerase/dehydratase family protein [Bernardetiaceae bacterium]
MATKTAIIVGATGLIGNALLDYLIHDERYEKIILLLRRKIETTSSKIEQKIVDFDNLAAHSKSIQGDHAFCCLGTTMKKAGSREAFYKVDYTYCFEFARLAAENAIPKFAIVTAMGADAKALVYYNRVKGEIEDAVRTLDFEAIHILRPSLLLGERKNDSRIGEDIAQGLSKALSFMIPDKYKGIEGKQVAKAMLSLMNTEEQGAFVHESDHLQAVQEAYV